VFIKWPDFAHLCEHGFAYFEQHTGCYLLKALCQTFHFCYFCITTPQPFYGPFSGTTWVSQCQKRTSLWCKGRLTEADTSTIRLGATPSRLNSAYLHHPPIFCIKVILFVVLYGFYMGDFSDDYFYLYLSKKKFACGLLFTSILSQ